MSNRSELLQTIIESSGILQRLMHARMQPLLQQLDMSMAQVMMLQAIRHQQPINARQLVSRLHITRGAVSQTLDCLLQADLIVRSTDTADRRLSNLYVSPAGQAKLQKFDELRAQALTKALAGLSDHELASYVTIQRTMINQFYIDKTLNKHTEEL